MADSATVALLQSALSEAISTLGLAAPARIDLREIPFEGEVGYGTALPLALAAQAKDRFPGKNNMEIAVALAEELRAALLQRTDLGVITVAPNGFLNFTFPKGSLVADVLTRVLSEGAGFGNAAAQRPGRVMVEFSQPNTHKAFHIGHLRNAALGAALVNIYRAAGYETVSANYYGDIGTHVIKSLWGYQRFYKGQEPSKRRGTFLGDVYTFAESKYAASEELKGQALAWIMKIAKEPIGECETELGARLKAFLTAERLSLAPTLDKRTLGANITRAIEQAQADIRRIEADDCPPVQVALRHFDTEGPVWSYATEVLDTFARWEAKDPSLLALWDETREWSLEEFREIYQQLGITFDVEFFESAEEDPGKEYVKELVAQGLAIEDKGATIVRIDEHLVKRRELEEGKEKFRTLIILRADGSSLYSTKDLSLARKKFQDHGITRSIYVVADEQAYYFTQVFKILELAGFEQAKDCFHLSYGLVTLPDGKMSSRKGNVVLYFDFAIEILRAAKSIVDAKQPDLAEQYKRDIARQVAFGAMKYDMLKVDAARTIVFDHEQALSLEGRTAPYIQYAHARACRILEKAKAELGASVDLAKLADVGAVGTPEVDLAKRLIHLPDVIEKSASENNPLPLASFVFDVAQEFNDFYNQVPVLKAEDPTLLHTRLALVDATRIVLENGLKLLGIEAPRVM